VSMPPSARQAPHAVSTPIPVPMVNSRGGSVGRPAFHSLQEGRPWRSVDYACRGREWSDTFLSTPEAAGHEDASHKTNRLAGVTGRRC
jgi:hypothetical protein